METLTKEELCQKYGFDHVDSFSEGLARVIKDGLEFHIEPDGRPTYEEKFEFVGHFSEGLAQVMRRPYEQFHIKPNGREAYMERYDFVEPFSGGLAWVRRNGQWHQIGPDGTKV